MRTATVSATINGREVPLWVATLAWLLLLAVGPGLWLVGLVTVLVLTSRAVL